MRKKIFLLFGLFACACALHAVTAAKGVFSVSASKTVQFANAPIATRVATHNLYKWREVAGLEDSSWQVLTGAEWSYLLASGRTDAADKNSLGIVDGHKGLIILPDSWEQPGDVPTFVGNYVYYDEETLTNVYSAEQWAKMANAGAVFLPCGGNGHTDAGAFVFDEDHWDEHGAYWAADLNPANNAQAYSIHFNNGEIHDQNTFADTTRYYSVILVRDVTITELDEDDYADDYADKWTAAKTKDYAYVNRTLRKDGTYYTLCLPFDVPDFDDSPLAGAEVFEFAGGAVSGVTGAEALYLHLNRLTGKRLKQGVPYILRWTATDPVQTLATPLHFEAVENWDTNTTADSVPGNETIKLRGVYPKAHIPGYTSGSVAHYNFFMGANNTLYWPDDYLYPSGPDHDMKGFRAYFYITLGGYPSSAPLRTMPVVWSISGGFGSTTGVESGKWKIESRKIFRDGQIVLVIEGKEYNLQGKQIK